ncbi:MAG: hypothetical protein E7178_04750 [Erysipelotrichaceae bacterium]|nr:hypothetical protein [Erysipelotrichaceae bacterium]
MEKIKLGDYFDSYGDGIHGTPTYDNNGEYFFVNGNNIRNGRIELDPDTPRISKEEYESIKRPLGENTVFVSINGTLGNVGFYHGEKIALGKSIAYLNLKKGIDKNFVRYILESEEFKKYSLTVAHGSTIKNLAPSQIADFEIDSFNDEEQAFFGDSLSPIDEKIANVRTLIRKYEMLLSQMYEFWFYQFDFPNEDGKPYFTSGGNLNENTEIKRKYPDGWKYQTLQHNDLVSIIQPGVDMFRVKNYLPTANIVGSEFFDGEDIDYENRETRANMQPIKNSVWFAKLKKSIKHLTLTEKDSWFIDRYILSTGFCGLKCKEYALGYIHCFINSSLFEYNKDVLAHGATQEGVNNDDLDSVNLLIPPQDVLMKFNKLSMPFIYKLNYCHRLNYELNKLKNYLLPQLMDKQFSKKKHN